MAYLFGVYLTDGSISESESTFKGGDKRYKSMNFSLKTIDREFADNTLKCIKKIIPECRANIYDQSPRVRYWEDGRVSKCQRQYCINVGFTKLGCFFREQTGDKHHIPYIIWGAPLPIKKWFIAGIIDGDGYCSLHTRERTMQCKFGVGGVQHGWIYEFIELLSSMDIRTNKPVISKREDRKTPFVDVKIKPYDFVKHGLFFTIQRKQNRVIEYRETFRD